MLRNPHFVIPQHFDAGEGYLISVSLTKLMNFGSKKSHQRVPVSRPDSNHWHQHLSEFVVGQTHKIPVKSKGLWRSKVGSTKKHASLLETLRSPDQWSLTFKGTLPILTLLEPELVGKHYETVIIHPKLATCLSLPHLCHLGGKGYVHPVIYKYSWSQTSSAKIKMLKV